MNKLVICIAALAGFAYTTIAEDKDGGYLKIWPKNHGTFLFVNTQDAIDAAVLKKPVEKLAQDMSFDIKLQSGKSVDIRVVPEELVALKAKGAIWIVNDPALPLVLAACENDWAILNVAPILADKPDAKKIDARLIRIVNRLFAYIHGTGDPVMMPQCVLKPAIGMEGIDNLVCRDYSPETFSKVTSCMNALGYRPCKSGSYADACEEGWAPIPTNNVQKAIWDRVHKLPTAPILIKSPKTKK